MCEMALSTYLCTRARQALTALLSWYAPSTTARYWCAAMRLPKAFEGQRVGVAATPPPPACGRALLQEEHGVDLAG
jgi:hypothetical protein